MARSFVARRASRSRSERGTVLLLVLIFAAMLALGTASILTTSQALSERVVGEARVGRAAAVGEAGLAYLCEQWRKNPTMLDVSDQNGDGKATTSAENSQVGVVRPLGAGEFIVLEVQDAWIAPTCLGKVVTIEGRVDGDRYRWRALLSPNLVSPIQGVATIQNQSWSGNASFDSLGGQGGQVFGNGSLTVSGNATITGDVSMGGTVSGAQAINGGVVQGASPVQFPDQTAIIASVIDQANNPKPAGFWSNPKTALAQTLPVLAMEAIDANPSALGAGWSSANTPNMKHMVIQGGNSSLPPGNYAFGRLWLDNAILTITSPPGGGTLVLSDLYLTNGARLIIDARNGPFTVVTATNNVYETQSAVGATNAQKWNILTSTWSNASPSIKLDGTLSGNIWNRTGGYPSQGPKPLRGTGSGYDDWTLKDSSVLAVVTAPNAKGVEFFMAAAADLVLANGSRIMAGLSGSDLPALQSSLTLGSQLDAMPQNALGFVAWSGGGDTPRLDINAGAGAGGLPTSFTGLTYGGFEGSLGAGGSLTGAFVGYSFTTAGTVRYDSRLAVLLTTPEADTAHVIVKRRRS